MGTYRDPKGSPGNPSSPRPARVLVDLSAEAQVIVVGSRGHGGFTGPLLGSVSSEVGAHAQCPVLITHRQRL